MLRRNLDAVQYFGTSNMTKSLAIKNDLFAPQLREGQIDHLGDPLASIDACIDFQALARAVDEAAE